MAHALNEHLAELGLAAVPYRADVSGAALPGRTCPNRTCPMARRDLIVVGASAGGVEALCEMAAGLPADLPAAVLVVPHLRAESQSALAGVLDRAGLLPAAAATDAAPLRAGTITVAPPGHHLIVTGTRSELSSRPIENGYRPAINALFRSAARSRDRRVIGVQLRRTRRRRRRHDRHRQGRRHDGRADPGRRPPPRDAERGAGAHRRRSRVAGAEIGPLLGALAGTAVDDGAATTPILDEHVERALWTGYRLLADKAGLAGRLEQVATEGGLAPMHRRHADIATETGAPAATLRRMLLDGLPAPRPPQGPR